MAIFQFREQLKLDTSLEDLWDFISSPVNLREITPDHMGFHIRTSPLPDKIYPGLMISYLVRPFMGIPMNWLTEITHVHEPFYFVDEQRSGPYAIWHHEHRLVPRDKGVLMSDLVTYRMPAGPIGRIAHRIFVKKQLDDIFRYREHALVKRFGRPL